MNWLPLSLAPSAGGSAVTTTSGPGLWLGSVAGLALVRCPLVGIVTGAITVTGLGTAAGY